MLGSILDPAADKLLGTTLVLTMAWKGLIPGLLTWCLFEQLTDHFSAAGHTYPWARCSIIGLGVLSALQLSPTAGMSLVSVQSHSLLRSVHYRAIGTLGYRPPR